MRTLETLTPVTWGVDDGVVAPAAMKTLEVTVALEMSPLVNWTVKPPEGAGADKVTARAVDCPTPTIRFAGRLMADGWVTVTVALALVMEALLAVMVTDPAATPVTGTLTLLVPA